MDKRPHPTAFWLLCILVVYGCQPELPEAREVYLDKTALEADYDVGVNNDLPALGRVLFYDKQMSINNSIACASCHKQALAFADNVAFSKGFENRLTSRNSMPIQNLIGNGMSSPDSSSGNITTGDEGFFGSSQVLFWDGRESDLDSMVMHPIVNHVEMGIMSLEQLVDKIRAVPYYNDLFLKAYGSDEITAGKIAHALSLFLQSIRSDHTKLDKSFPTFDVNGIQSSQGTPLSGFELLGQQLFVEKYNCNSCHQVQDPHGYLQLQAGTFSNIGLDVVYEDDGRGGVTALARDNGKFKIPSLRNVALTAPYMHDGRFETLSDVIDHYSHGLANNPNLDHKLRGTDGNPLQLNISADEKRAIIAFLNTLTDQEMICDPKFSNPFKSK